MKTTIRTIEFLCIYLFISTSVFANVDVDKNALMKRASRLQMPFIENQGQINKAEGTESVRFYANTFAGTVFVTDKGEIVYSLIKSEDKNTEHRQMQDAGYKIQDVAAGFSLRNSELSTLSSNTKAIALKESLVYSNQRPDTDKIKGLNKSETKVNYFKGAKEDWRTNIPTWQEVSLGEVYKGVELKLKAYGNNVEKLFTVHPKGSVEDIKLKLKGAKSLRINDNGELEIETEIGVVKFTKPVAYQEINDKKVQVAAEYVIARSSEGSRDDEAILKDEIALPESVLSNETRFLAFARNDKDEGARNDKTGNDKLIYSFKVGAYDKTKPLIIDPLLSSTFIGGSSYDSAYGIALDASGNVFVSGYTSSLDYPADPSAYDTTFNGNNDIFISKLSNDLSSLLASTFIGGSSDDSAYGIALDSSGNVFAAGYTSSSDYPADPSAYDTTFNGNRDVFVSKLSNDLTSLLSSTFIGGSSYDSAYALAIDSLDNVFVTGYAYPSNYPITSGAYDITFNGNSDVFVSKLNNSLSTLLASTFIGGSNYDSAYAIAIDASGNVFTAGWTASSNYSTTPLAYDTTFNGGYRDVFISKLNNDLSSLVSSTLIGGNSNDFAYALSVDALGNVFAAGYTSSSNYPATSLAYDTTCGTDGNCDTVVTCYEDEFGNTYCESTPYDDSFISKLSNDLSSLVSSTFIGGSGGDYVRSLSVDALGNVFAIGYTTSSDYPITSSYDTTFNGNNDAFISKLDGSLSSLVSSTFIGGNSDDFAYALDLDSSGNVFAGGYTSSSDYPTTSLAYDTTFNGYSDVFISKLDSNLSEFLDNDGDGYASDADCDDNDPNINPGATEVCDGVDNDCDGSVDEGSDTDNDGYTTCGGDCNDNDPTVNPGMSEVRGNGKDDDCNPVTSDYNVDLYVPIASVTAPSSASPGSTIIVGATVNKSGSGSAAASTARIYIYGQLLGTPTNYFKKLDNVAVSAFGAGAGSDAISATVTIPSWVVPGSHQIIVRADLNNDVPEWNESNNRGYKVITIVP